MIAAEPQKPAEPPPLRPRRKEPSPLGTIIAYLLFVPVIAALVAPRLYRTAHYLNEEISQRFGWLANQPFHLYMKGCIIVMALVAAPSFFKALGIRSAGEIGLKAAPRHWVEGIHGLLWGFVTVGLAAALLVGSDVRELSWNHGTPMWMAHLKSAAISAMLVALLEEILFRGAIFGAMRRRQAFATAAVVSGLIYALLHFFDRAEVPYRLEWNTGLMMISQSMLGLFSLEKLIPAALSLLILGVLLAMVYERTEALHFAIGLHAGLVFCLKTLNFITTENPNVTSGFWGSTRLVDGWFCAILLFLVLLLIDRILPPRKVVEE